jgi:hypothetical protein
MGEIGQGFAVCRGIGELMPGGLAGVVRLAKHLLAPAALPGEPWRPA